MGSLILLVISYGISVNRLSSVLSQRYIVCQLLCDSGTYFFNCYVAGLNILKSVMPQRYIIYELLSDSGLYVVGSIIFRSDQL